MTKYQRFSLLYAVFVLTIFLTGCGGWTSAALSVVTALSLAVPMLVNILVAFSAELPAPVLDAVQKWSAEAVKALGDVKTLILAFKNAAPNDQAGIVEKIQGVLAIVSDNLSTLLPDLHVTNDSVQRLVELVVAQFSALLGIIPVLQGKVTSHRERVRLQSAVLDSEEFKSAFNEEASQLGAEYTI